jgi:hypothetical protein
MEKLNFKSIINIDYIISSNIVMNINNKSVFTKEINKSSNMINQIILTSIIELEQA